jgi:hypothetical protein
MNLTVILIAIRQRALIACNSSEYTQDSDQRTEHNFASKKTQELHSVPPQ